MAEDKKGTFNNGFAVGFVTSMALCFVYWGLMAAEQGTSLVAPVEVYRYKAPKLVDLKDPSTSLILKYGVPDRGPETIRYLNHVVGYDQARKIPLWVAEHITMEHITGEGDRDKCRFMPDRDSVNDMFSSTLDDYSKSGFDRGHMSPAANHKYSQDAMCDSFYLTNVLPQNSQFNRNYWLEVERYCRDLAERYEEVRVITGPVLLPVVAEGATRENRFVQYEVIGESNVTVPTHFFKVIMIENSTDSSNTTLFAAAFLFPHTNLVSGIPLINFKVPLAQLEAAAGLRFFPQLAGAPVGDLCSVDPCKLRSEKGASCSTMLRLLLGVMLIAVIFIWVFLMYRWREQVENAKKK